MGETFAGIPFKTGIKLSNELKTFCQRDISMVEVSLRCILDHKEVVATIPRASSPTHIYNNARVSDLPQLSKKLVPDLEAFYQNKVHEHILRAY